MNRGHVTQSLADVIDRLEVRELLDRYSHAVDFMNWELLETVFAIDAVVDYSELSDTFGDVPTVARGFAAIRALYAAIMPPNYGTMHYMTNHLIHIDGDVAHTRTYMHVLSTTFSGIYRCECRRTDQGWRISDYRFVIHTRAHPASPESIALP
jgi:SnoaL-like domain